MIKIKKLRTDTIRAHAALADKSCVIDVHKEIKRGNFDKKRGIVTANYGDGAIEQKLDLNRWLPFAAKKYKISDRIEDYVFVPVFTIPSDLPNRNGVGFPLQSLIEFNPDTGDQAYKSFKGKPTFLEHENKDYTKAHGVIVDTFMNRLKGYQGNIWKLLELLAFDRNKYDTAKRILSGDLNTYSMGAYVDKYSCSYCGKELGQCTHVKKNRLDFYEKDGVLVYKNLHGIDGFETSAVGTPAFPVAISDILKTSS